MGDLVHALDAAYTMALHGMKHAFALRALHAITCQYVPAITYHHIPLHAIT